jgi:type IV fimbrial biogenesis protein FimT
MVFFRVRVGSMNRQKGFTLIEMMATIGVATVLLAVATPSFLQMNRNNRIITYTNDFVGTVNLARAEAIRRGAPVKICPSDDAASCSDDWNTGWIVFADRNADGTRDIDEDDETKSEPLLRTHEALAQSYTLNSTEAFDTGITYGADGAAHATGLFAVCKDANIVNSRAIVVTRLRPRVARDTDEEEDRIPNLDDDVNLDSCTDL